MTNEYDEDFVKEGTVGFVIDGRQFMYNQVTAGDEISWLQEYMKIGKDGKPYQDHAALNRLKMQNLVNVPYDGETIKKTLKLNGPTPWSSLDKAQRWTLLCKLTPSMFDKIQKAIEKIDRPDETKKKS